MYSYFSYQNLDVEVTVNDLGIEQKFAKKQTHTCY